MPNIVAYTALLLWPAICVLLFSRLSRERAIIWSLLAGYLLLPPVANFNLPLLPSLDKTTIPSLSVMAICLWLMRDRLSLIPASRLAQILIVLFVVGAIPTVLANRDPTVFSVLPDSEPIIFRTWQLPGLRFRDIISVTGNQLIALVPFLLARRYLATETAQRDLLLAFVIAGLAYSIPSLIEIRFSPQLNILIYGFFQHDFAQAIRDGGFRPFVFLPHGLWLALFILTTLLAATALARSGKEPIQMRFVLAMIYLAAVLYLCKSLGSQLYALALLPVVFFTGPRTQLRIAVGFALFATIYPLLRGGGYVPTEDLLSIAESFSPERAASLAYRFYNEDLLLQQAAQKPWLGWGGWGRNLIHDPNSARILTIPDGRWIITFGTYGWLGYVTEFGLIALPIFLLGWASFTSSAAKISRPAAAIALILAINMIDLLVNATLTPVTWIMAGAALGYAEKLRRSPARRADTPTMAEPVIGRLPRQDGPRTAM